LTLVKEVECERNGREGKKGKKKVFGLVGGRKAAFALLPMASNGFQW
jgi:hypothetical protein